MARYVAAKLPGASAPALSKVSIDDFLGVDLTNPPAGVDVRRSPDAENMIRDVPGRVRKRMGWQTVQTLPGRINGRHPLHGSVSLIHAGTALYRMGEDTPLYEGLDDERSMSWEFEGLAVIADGQQLLLYDGETVCPASEGAKVPLVTIAKAPAGGGQQYEDLNLLQPKFTEMFLGTAEDAVYQLSFAGLDEDAPTVEVLQADGSWKVLEAGTDYTVDYEAGTVTFAEAPGASVVAGEDNVRITAKRTVDGYADRINRCRIGTQFGVSGAPDRLFLAGNPDLQHYDWYSGQNDPTYWADTAYSVLGQSDSAIVGYSVVNARLATHKNGTQAQRNVIVRQGDLVDSKPSFPVVNILQGEGAVGPYTFGYLCTEPMFLTALGVYAITAQDITGEKYSQNRSFYLNGALLDEEGLEDAYACVYNDMYWLCVNDKAYILDGLQVGQTDKAMPYATRQYAGFLCTNIPARVMWTEDGVLWFGSADGRVCRFYTDPDALGSYNDDGEPIYACWRTPDLTGKNVYRAKTFSRFYVALKSAAVTGVRALARERGLWEELFRDESGAQFLSFAHMSFARFTFSSDDTPHVIGDKTRLKGLDKVGYKVENNALNEPFGLENISVEFVETGYYRA